MKFTLLLVFSFLVLQVPAQLLEEIKPLHGSWLKVSQEGDTLLYKKVDTLHLSQEGIEFFENGGLLKRQADSDCEVPSEELNDYEGYWEMKSEPEIHIMHMFCDGRAYLDYDIQDLNQELLSLVLIKEEILYFPAEKAVEKDPSE